jgi:hypothetical protein
VPIPGIGIASVAATAAVPATKTANAGETTRTKPLVRFMVASPFQVDRTPPPSDVDGPGNWR